MLPFGKGTTANLYSHLDSHAKVTSAETIARVLSGKNEDAPTDTKETESEEAPKKSNNKKRRKTHLRTSHRPQPCNYIIYCDKTEDEGSVSYGECGSGVIFDDSEGAYYALTAAHVVSNENAELLVFTVNTDMKTENIPGIDNMNVLSENVYDSMHHAELIYSSQRDDIAVILSVLKQRKNYP